MQTINNIRLYVLLGKSLNFPNLPNLVENFNNFNTTQTNHKN